MLDSGAGEIERYAEASVDKGEVMAEDERQEIELQYQKLSISGCGADLISEIVVHYKELFIKIDPQFFPLS